MEDLAALSTAQSRRSRRPPPARTLRRVRSPQQSRPDPTHAAEGPPGPSGPLRAIGRLRAARYDPGLPGVAVLVAVAVAAAALAVWFLLGSRPTPVPAPPPETRVEQPGAAAVGAADDGDTSGGAGAGAPSGEVVVAVAGTVARPGVVRLPAGSRVVDAVEAAGGVLPGADPGLLNLARVLADGEQVLVGVEPPPGSVDPAGGAAPTTDAEGRVDLNRATAGDLDELPGVGPVLAERIVAHRERVRPFTGVEELRDVEGIGESRYAELQQRVVVG